MLNFVLQPWQLLLVILAGWVNQQQQQVIEYLRCENQVLREKLGKRRILLNDAQRRRLAVKGKILGRKRLAEIGALFTPDTILRWHRKLVARKWNYADRRTTVGRPRVRPETMDLVLRFARENPTWGYDRIQGALANVGCRVSDTTVGNTLKQHGLEPAPDRRRTGAWSTFLKAHWETLAAIDFTACEVWTLKGLVTYYILIVIELKTRRVEIAGVTTHPDAAWMTQIARNLTDEAGFLRECTHLILDRDTKFQPLREYLVRHTKTEPVLLPPRSPDLNSYVERFVRSLKSECLGRLVFFSEAQLRRALSTFRVHYHTERNHQGLGNQLIAPGEDVGRIAGSIRCSERLGGMLRYYHRDAA